MKLIINADDFGFTSGITYGIYDAIKNGVVTSTTMMVNQKATLLAADLIKNDPTLNVGLHINLCIGKPLTTCPSLVDENNNFMKPKDILTDERYKEEEIFQEISAQYQRFVELVGKKPTHLDSHLYAHQRFPKVKAQVLRLSELHHIPIREFENAFYSPIVFERNFKVLENEPYASMIQKFKKLISDNLGHEVVELMVHPGFIDEEIKTLSSYSMPRTLEHYVLTRIESRIFLEDNVQLISFRDLQRKNHGQY